MSVAVIGVLLAAAIAFAVAGVAYSRKTVGDLEDYITARGSFGGMTTAATLVASGMGAWILFGPVEAATWGGLPAITGYALGSALPLLAFIALGRRLRNLMPEGHTLTEYVFHRYGRGMYTLTLIVMVFYMFIFLAAEITGMALIASLVAGVPLWTTALIVLTATLAYTTYGGLRASIFTDNVQTTVILPLLAILLAAGYVLLGGAAPTISGLSERAPELLSFGHIPGLEGGATFLIAILAANLFHQGYWQRVYAARDERAMTRGFLTAAVVVIPIVFAMGLFGLAAVGLGQAETPSVALFSVLLDAMPPVLILALVLLGFMLVMSSADTLINGLASLVAVDARRAMPRARPHHLLRLSRYSTLILAVPLLVIAAQGYSVLYLFLVADLVCAAAVFPVFFGLYSKRYTGLAATASTLAALLAGWLLFPNPSMTEGSLFWSFTAAVAVSVAVSLAMTLLARSSFDMASLARSVRYIKE
ncbi:MAG: sodium:solute symporter family transporter [Rubrobacteraceae bacterium]